MTGPSLSLLFQFPSAECNSLTFSLSIYWCVQYYFYFFTLFIGNCSFLLSLFISVQFFFSLSALFMGKYFFFTLSIYWTV